MNCDNCEVNPGFQSNCPVCDKTLKNEQTCQKSEMSFSQIVLAFLCPYIMCWVTLKKQYTVSARLATFAWAIMFISPFIASRNEVLSNGFAFIALAMFAFAFSLAKNAKRQKEEERIQREEERIQREEDERKIVNAHSSLIHRIKKLNAETCYMFTYTPIMDYISNVKCNSKKEFDSYDFRKMLVTDMRGRMPFYEQLISKYEGYTKLINETKQNYDKYFDEYSKCELYAAPEDIVTHNISHSRFIELEKIFFNTSKKTRPIFKHVIFIFNLTYSTPAGRNKYDRHQRYSLAEMKELLCEAKVPTPVIMHPKSISESQLENKRLKLEQKALELAEKEKTFREATQNHIYSSNATPLVEMSKPILSEDQNQWVKLKKLKQSFDSGEISYHEYSTQRSELI